MKYGLQYSLIIIISLFLFACGGGEDGNGNNDNIKKPGTIDTALVGSWTSPCNGSSLFSVQTHYRINDDGTYEMRIRTYNAAGCSASSIPSPTLSGTYSIGQDVTISTGNMATQIEFVNTQIVQLPGDPVDVNPAQISRGLYLLDASGTTLYLNAIGAANNDPAYPTDLPLMQGYTKSQ